MFLQRFKRFFFPRSCPVCGEPIGSDSVGLCGKCRSTFIRERDILCPHCGKKAAFCTCPVPHLKNYAFPETLAAVCRFYNSDHQSETGDMTRRLILQGKRDSRQGIADILSADLAVRVAGILSQHKESPREWIVTWAPRNPNNLLAFGFDHGELIAKALASRLGCSTRPTMFRFSGEMQKDMDMEERISNASSGLAPRKKGITRGGKYILVDDVITTGATMAAASDLLYQWGAEKVLPAAAAKTMLKITNDDTKKGGNHG